MSCVIVYALKGDDIWDVSCLMSSENAQNFRAGLCPAPGPDPHPVTLMHGSPGPAVAAPGLDGTPVCRSWARRMPTNTWAEGGT